MEDIYFNCPDFFHGLRAYGKLIYLYDHDNFLFNDGVKIKSIFGAFPNMIWAGGSYDLTGFTDYRDVKGITDFYNLTCKVPIKFTLTNMFIEQKHLGDEYCNEILEICENNMNEVIVVSPLLEEHIRTNYPKYKIQKSIIATKDQSFFLEDKYFSTVLARRENKNFELLNSIPKEQRSKVEILCNDPCDINCPRLYQHYEEYAKAQIDLTVSPQLQLACTTIDSPYREFISRARPEFISYSSIVSDYLPLGYNNFKISGRMDPPTTIEQLADFLIKPEYQMDVRIAMVREYLSA